MPTNERGVTERGWDSGLRELGKAIEKRAAPRGAGTAPPDLPPDGVAPRTAVPEAPAVPADNRQRRQLELLATITGKPPRGGGHGRAGRSLRRAFDPTASADVYGATEDLRRVTQPVTTCRRILVGGVRGGAGATTLAALLACAFVKHRNDLVLAMDAAPGHGSLEFRLDGTAVWTDADLAALAGRNDAREAAQLARGRGRLSLLPRPAGTDLDAYWEQAARLTRFYGVALIDGGHDSLTTPGYLDGAAALVLAVPATVDGARCALAWLDEADPGLWRRTVPVLVGRAPHSGLRRPAAVRALRAGETAATWLAYDPVLATGAPLDLASLAEETVRAVVRVAGAALTLAAGVSGVRS